MDIRTMERITDLAYQELSRWRPDHNPSPAEVSTEFRRCLKIAEYKVKGQKV